MDEDSSSAGLMAGEQMTLENVLYCMMISSANEASNAVAEYIAGSTADFVRMMNERAYELGCTNTHFANTNGLHDERHYTTARDLAIITQAALKSETFKKITNTAEYVVPATNLAPERRLKTTNQLILKSSSNPYYYSKAAGVKTGYTGSAGRCIITTAKSDGMSFLAVICGAKTTILPDGGLVMENFPDAMMLLDYAFDGYSQVTALSTLYPVAQVAVANSAGAEAVAVAPSRDIKLLMPNCYNEDELKTVIKLDNQTAEAPIHAGDKLGVVNISFQGQVLETADLIAIADVARSEISAVGNSTSAYIQQNWWKWLVILIVIAIALIIVLLVYRRIQIEKARRRRLHERRRALEERMRQYHDDL
ncbi:MAG: serine hydrolase [Clostridia bacterium]|nr:serine hydrolase [Clostridia bacterium]